MNGPIPVSNPDDSSTVAPSGRQLVIHVKNALDRYQQILEHGLPKGRLKGLSTGFSLLDGMCHGLEPDSQAQPRKTAAKALQVACHRHPPAETAGIAAAFGDMSLKLCGPQQTDERAPQALLHKHWTPISAKLVERSEHATQHVRNGAEILGKRQFLRRWLQSPPGVGWRLGIEMDEQGVTLVTQLIPTCRQQRSPAGQPWAL